jgi:Flp pilus assembly protein TadG
MTPLRRPTTRAQALVEFALVLPVLLLILFVIFDFGRAIYAYNAISNAAREGGRTAIINQYPDAVRAKAAQQATAVGLPTTDPGGCPAAGGPTSATTGVCFTLRTGPTLGSACTTPPTLGCVAVVDVKTTFTAITPIIGNIVGPIPITAQTQQIIEFVCDTSSCPTR